MVISNQWDIWKVSNSERPQKVKALVLDDNWWAHVRFVLDFTESTMTMPRFADTDTPCLGDVYDGMDTMVEKVKVFIQHQNDPTKCEALCNKVEAIIHHHWEMMTTPLHFLAYALSPRYYSEKVLSMQIELHHMRMKKLLMGATKLLQNSSQMMKCTKH